LLIQILPKLGGSGWLILSGILRSQQEELVRALQRTARYHRHEASREMAGFAGEPAPALCGGRTIRRQILRRSSTAATVKTDAI
jgi:hypothetical protein